MKEKGGATVFNAAKKSVNYSRKVVSMSWQPYSKYKDSGVEWLGEIPTNWKIHRLKHIASTRFSNVDKHTVDMEKPVQLCNYVDVYYNDFIKPEISFMSATASDSEIEKFQIKNGDVLVTKDSESWDDIAVPAFVSSDLGNVLCGYHLAMVRPDEPKLDGNFLFRSFGASGVNDQFRIAATGITRYGLGKHGIDNALFIVPPLTEQTSIAAFLDRETTRIDALIEKKQRQIELLQEKRAALISHAVIKGLNPDAKMKDSGIEWLGEIPEHWEIYRAKVLLREVNERSSTGDEELLSVSHLTGVSPRSEKNVNMFMAESLEGYKICEPGDLVINTMWAWMGAMGISPVSGIVSPSYNVYRFRHDNITPLFYDYLFRTGRFISKVICQSKGVWSSRLRLYPEALYEIRLPRPPFAEQKEIINAIEDATGKYEILQNKIEISVEKLQEYRTALISAAVTGKIDVRKETV